MKPYQIFFLILYPPLLIIFLAYVLGPSSKNGVIVLCGGSEIPIEAISWLKSHSKNNKCVVVSCYKNQDLKWLNHFDDVTFLLAEELKESHLIGLGNLVLCGGDQWLYLNRLDSKLIDKFHYNGGSILATSASAMILSSDYFTAENGTISVWEALDGHNVIMGNNFVHFDELKDTVIESHYSQRQRRERLKVFMGVSNAKIGIGIDENTSLCINGSKTIVFGSGNVEFIRKQ